MGRRRQNLAAAWTAGKLAARRIVQRKNINADLALGRALTDQLDQMKGLAMKVGQIVSYLDIPLPDEVQAQLAQLQTGALGRPLSELHDVVEASLGAGLAELFDDIEPEPVAAASIGQVHKAHFRGDPVAVKIQYPEIAETFSADLGTVDRFAALAGLASAVDGRAIVRELAARLTEECDYAREARAQMFFTQSFADDDAVSIPGVLQERSGPQVLTTVWKEGADFESFKRRASVEARRQAARTLTRFTYRGLLVYGAIQADPHPGNFAFPNDSRVLFFDFGCVRELDVGMVDALRRQSAALLSGDKTAFRQASLDLGVVGVPEKFDYDHYFMMMRHLYLPFIETRFDFDPSFVRKAMDFNGPGSPNARTIAMPPAYIWVARLQWGLWSVIARLGVDVELRDILEEQLAVDAALAELDTTIGATSEEAA